LDIETEYMIVGNSVAAISAIESIRSCDREGECTVLTAEGERIYSRPMLAHLIAGELSEKEILFRSGDFFEGADVRVMTGQKVASIDPEKMTATADTGLGVSFKKALIATGSRPKVLDIEGIGSRGVFFFQSLADTRQIMKALDGVESAVIIGAGLIGMRAAYALNARGIKVTLVEMMDRVMPKIMDTEGSDILADAMRDEGTEVVLGSTVESILEEGGAVKGARVKGGKEIPCQILFITAGVEPNLEFTSGSGIEVDQGIIVDQFLETSKSGIFAAGDVVEFSDKITGRYTVNANWPNAFIQGRFAGTNMTGNRHAYDGSIGMNSIECGGIPSVTMGLVNPQDESYLVRSHIARENRLYRKLVYHSGRVVGAILIGHIERAGLLLGLINDKIDVSGLEDDILHERKSFFDLVRDRSRDDNEGKIDWPGSLGSEERYEKKFDQGKWDERIRGERKW
jgi:NAD(P)H-nitrite reductase large subunit